MKRLPKKINLPPEVDVKTQPLRVIVAYCLENGSVFSDRWRRTPNGGTCVLAGQINMQDIVESYNLPDHIILERPYANCLWDRQHNDSVCFVSVAEHEAYLKQKKETKNSLPHDWRE